MNVALNENVKNISISDITNLTVNGKPAREISIPVITVGADGSTTDNGVTTGSFTYSKGTLAVGDTIMIYAGDTAPTIDDTTAGDTTAFVEITERNGSSYSYKSANVEKVLFTPDILPVSEAADMDGSATNNSITVPVSVMTYTDDLLLLA